MKLKFILIFTFLVSVKSLNAQSYSELFDKNEIFSNPAYFGYENEIDVGVSLIPYLSNYSSTPFEEYSFAEVSLDSINSGFGITELYEEIGPSKKWQMGFGYNYIFKIHEKSKLRLGINTAFQRYKLLASDFNLIDNGDEPIQQKDLTKIIFPNFGIGVLYSYKNFSLGCSVNDFLYKKIISTNSDSSLLYLNVIKKFSITSSYLFTINKKHIIQPSLFCYFSSDGPMNLFVNLKYKYDNKLFVVLTLSNNIASLFPIRIGVTLFDCLDLSYGRTIKVGKTYFSGYQAFSLAFKMKK